MKELRLKVNIGDVVTLSAKIEAIDKSDGYNPIMLGFGSNRHWLCREDALAAGIVEEVERGPQVGDVYKSRGGFTRTIVALEAGNVYYTSMSPAYNLAPFGCQIREIADNWGELQ